MEREVLEQIMATSSSQHEDGLRDLNLVEVPRDELTLTAAFEAVKDYRIQSGLD